MIEQLVLPIHSAALDECGVVGSTRGKPEGAVATHHESAQTMAQDGSAGGVSAQPSQKSFHIHCARTWFAAARYKRQSGFCDPVVYWTVIGMARAARRDATTPEGSKHG